MQIRRAKDGRQVLVVYSMGNFISGMRKPDTRGGAMVRVKVGWQNGKPVVKSAGYKLVFVQDPDKSVPNYSLVPADREWLVRADQRSFLMLSVCLRGKYSTATTTACRRIRGTGRLTC